MNYYLIITSYLLANTVITVTNILKTYRAGFGPLERPASGKRDNSLKTG
jgi:hypothetical protein